MKKIVLCGNYGGINSGDEAILQGFLSVLQDNCDLTVLSHNPQHTAETYGVKSCYVFPMGVRSMIKHTFNGQKKKTLAAIKNADLFIVGGGSLFTDEESNRAPSMWSWQVKAAVSCNTKVVMFGQTVGPIQSDYLKNLTAETFNMAEEIYVRDQQSKDFLKKIKVQKPIQVTGDCALLINKKLTAKYNPDGPVLFIPRDWSDGMQVDQIRKKLAKLTGKKVQLISLYRDQENFEKEDSHRTACLSPDDLLAQMQNSSLVVSMRLHGSILAAVAGVPFVPLSYSPKVNSFIKEIEYPFIFDWANLAEEKVEAQLAEAIEHLEKNWPQINKNLSNKITEKAEETENYLKTFLK